MCRVFGDQNVTVGGERVLKGQKEIGGSREVLEATGGGFIYVPSVVKVVETIVSLQSIPKVKQVRRLARAWEKLRVTPTDKRGPDIRSIQKRRQSTSLRTNPPPLSSSSFKNPNSAPSAHPNSTPAPPAPSQAKNLSQLAINATKSPAAPLCRLRLPLSESRAEQGRVAEGPNTPGAVRLTR